MASIQDTRKRPRSLSGSSQSSASKRAPSEDPSQASTRNNTPPVAGPSSSPALQEMIDQSDRVLSLQELAQSTSQLTNDQKLRKINDLRATKLTVGETWYVVSKKWYRQWEDMVSGRVPKGGTPITNIGPVDNSSITTLTGDLTPNITEGVTMELVPEAAWRLFEAWYGPSSKPHARKVISVGRFNATRVELYPLTIYLAKYTPNQPSTFSRHVLSASTTMEQLRTLTGVKPEEKAHIVRFDESDDFDRDDFLLTREAFDAGEGTILVGPGGDLSLTISDLSDGEYVAVCPDGLFPSADTSPVPTPTPPPAPPAPIFTPEKAFFGPSKKSPESVPNSSANGWAVTAPSPKTFKAPALPARVKGTVGLNNLGNTCFMNSALQCLAHTPELTEYFQTGVYTSELNPDNPLSTGGDLAKSYGDLMKSLFPASSHASSYNPRQFKSSISRHAPAFSGYQQHDTQELLAFLLDGLHEDLNRVIKKPYVEKPDWEGGGLKEVVKLANETWDGYMKRNDSVIVDLFQGQFKSTLVCPQCSKVSITFDPFMYLTLPLPVHKMWRHDISYVPWDSDKPHVVVNIEIPQNSTFKDLKIAIGKCFGSNPDNLLSADMFSHRFYKFFKDPDPVTDAADNDHVIVYELPVASRQSSSFKPSPSDPFLIPIFHLLPQSASGPRTYGGGGGWDGRKPYGVPLIAVIDRETASSAEGIYDAIVERFKPWTAHPEGLYRWEATEDDSIIVSDANTDAESSSDAMDIIEEERPSMAIDSQDDADEDDSPHANGFANVPSSPAAQIVGTKEDLFHMHLHQSQKKDMETGWQMENGNGRLVLWEDRVAIAGKSVDAESESEDGGDGKKESIGGEPLLRHSDAIICEWEPFTLDFFFGSDGNGADSRWATWPRHVDAASEALSAKKKSERKTEITLEDCLDEFTKEEKLGEDDLWYCPQCKKHQQATKQFELWKVPDVLVVHLKRFSNSRMLRDKIDDLVDFPIEGLDLASRVGERLVADKLKAAGEDISQIGLNGGEESLMYDLFAVDEHAGGLGGGHYRAYAKNEDDDQWWLFDDSHVSKTTPERAVNRNAYLLFYRRRTERPLGGQSYEKVKTARETAPVEPEEELEPAEVTTYPSSSSARTTALAPAFVDNLKAKNRRRGGGGAAILAADSDDDLPTFEQSYMDRILPTPAEFIRPSSPASSTGAERDDTEEEEREDELRPAWERTRSGSKRVVADVDEDYDDNHDSQPYGLYHITAGSGSRARGGTPGPRARSTSSESIEEDITVAHHEDMYNDGVVDIDVDPSLGEGEGLDLGLI